jgi:DNA-directed RNA polymerase subunit RPC12/RpoP
MATALLTLCPRCGGVVDAPIGASLYGKALCTCTRARKSQRTTKSSAINDAARSSESETTATINAPVAPRPGIETVTVDLDAKELASQLRARQKLCCVCGKDVTHDRRMKDGATGRYWCYDCGSKQPQHVQHAMDVPCPECHRRVPATRLIKLDERYLCPACYTRHTGGADGRPLPVMFVVGLVLLALVLYGLFALNLL